MPQFAAQTKSLVFECAKRAGGEKRFANSVCSTDRDRDTNWSRLPDAPRERQDVPTVFYWLLLLPLLLVLLPATTTATLASLKTRHVQNMGACQSSQFVVAECGKFPEKCEIFSSYVRWRMA